MTILGYSGFGWLPSLLYLLLIIVLGYRDQRRSETPFFVGLVQILILIVLIIHGILLYESIFNGALCIWLCARSFPDGLGGTQFLLDSELFLAHFKLTADDHQHGDVLCDPARSLSGVGHFSTRRRRSLV